MVALRRSSSKPYRCDLTLVPLEDVANVEKKLPVGYINSSSNGIQESYRDYCEPLIGRKLPQFVRFGETE
jgi:6-phosphofructokinase 1